MPKPPQNNPGHRFKPGQSGNPGGRPKEVKEVVDLARQHSVEAILRLAEWVRSDDPRASVAAANAILDRAFGRPTQAVEHKGAVSILDGMSVDALRSLQSALVAFSGGAGGIEDRGQPTHH